MSAPVPFALEPNAIAPAPARRPAGRCKLWQIDAHWHCLIIGTCLDVTEARSVATSVGFEHDAIEDYQVHHACVHAAGNRRHALATGLQKRLEKKHAREIRQFGRERDPARLRALWEAAREDGDIGGALWALVTHAARDNELLDSIYGEVHMLQHGSSAREARLRRRMAVARQQAEALAAEHAIERERLLGRLQSVRERVSALERELGDCRASLATAARERDATNALGDQPEPTSAMPNAVGDDPSREATTPALILRQTALIETLRERAARRRLEATRAARERRVLRAENARLECLLGRSLDRDSCSAANGQRAASATDGTPSLCGRCVLVIGGQAHQCRHFRALVETNEGVFLHHDGGVEDKPARVAELVRRADAVLCPTEQVSHDAMRRAKRLCRAEDKPMIFMQRSSLAAFADGLEQVSRAVPR